MPKRSRGRARPPIARTSGQSASAIDKESLHGETNKTSDLALDNVEPGEVMSGNQGVKISDDQNSLKAGPRGPTLMEDFHLREKITHFDHERIPERVVHARGAAAHGVFEQVRTGGRQWDRHGRSDGGSGDRSARAVRASHPQSSRDGETQT